MNNATNQKTNLILDWNDVAYSQNYRLQVSTNSNFTTTVIDNWIASSNYSASNLNYNTTYYWRVLAADFADTTAYSSVWNFKTTEKLSTPELVSIANNDEYVSLVPELIWASVPNAENYRIQIARDINFSNIVSDVSISTVNYVVESGKLSQLLNYYWRVNAFSTLDTSNWSSVWKFKTGNNTALNRYISTLTGNKDNSCNSEWLENDIIVSAVLTNSADCGGAGNCNFTNLNDKIALSNGKLRFNIEAINPFVDSVKIYIKNNCGSNCTNAFLQNGSFIINQASSTANGIITLTLKNNNSYVSDIYVSSCNAEILELMIYGNGTYPNDIPADWSYTSETGKSSIIKLSKNIPHLINGRKFMVGDAIGAFFDDNGTKKCAGYKVWDGSNLEITVWGDDSNTPEKDGFANSENYSFKLWDSQESKAINARVKYLSGDNFFANNTTSELSEIYGEDVVQNIVINQGWNLNSSYIIPTNASLPNIFNDIKDDIVIVKNSSGKIYLPSSGTNTIGNWNYKEAYQIYAKKQLILKINGTEAVPQNTDIYLIKGWSLVPYLRKFESNINTQLSTIEQHNVLVIAKNSAGQVYIPNGVNTINNMKLGQGYQMYLSRVDTLVYPANYLSRSSSSEPIENYDSKLFAPKSSNTGNNSTLIINTDLEDDSELAVFDNESNLVGTSRVVAGKSVITIWGDNEMTDFDFGAKNSAELSIKLYNAKSNEFEDLKGIVIRELLSNNKMSNLIYNKDAVYVLDNYSNNEIELSINPNPVSNNAEIEFILKEESDITLNLYDNAGNKIQNLINSRMNAGTHRINLNTELISSGNYNLILSYGNKTISEKLIILK